MAAATAAFEVVAELRRQIVNGLLAECVYDYFRRWSRQGVWPRVLINSPNESGQRPGAVEAGSEMQTAVDAGKKMRSVGCLGLREVTRMSMIATALLRLPTYPASQTVG